MFSISAEHLHELEAIHRQVDGLVASIADRLGDLLVCRRGCHSCCQDDLAVLEVEAVLIQRHAGELLASAEAGPSGGCAFLDSTGACRIYPWRPYICRTQGLPLRWFEGEYLETEGRSICHLNLDRLLEAGQSLGDLEEGLLWTLGPWEGKLASLNADATGKFISSRVPLRDLFDYP
jgi:Fe-S-cluster containining protein